MEKNEEKKSQYKCNDCNKLSWTTLRNGCRKCSSKNLEKLSDKETKEFEVSQKKLELIKLMSNHTDKELINIVKVKRIDYTQEAIEVAEKELQNRQLNFNQITHLQRELIDKEKRKKRNKIIKYLILPLAIIAISFLSGILSITTDGCTLPFDIVFFDYACLFGSFGASLGATIAATIVATVLLFILGSILRFIVGLFR